MPTYNILPEDKITSRIADTKFIKLEVTHRGCDEPFLELYIHRNKADDIITAMEYKNKGWWISQLYATCPHSGETKRFCHSCSKCMEDMFNCQ
jgi:siroheme synthase